MNCPICNKQTCVLIEDYENYKTYHCLFCGIDFSNPMYAAKLEFYETEDIYDPNKLIIASKIPNFGYKNFFLDKPASGGDLLDIGCGIGTFPYLAQKEGYKVTGIDFNSKLIDFGKNYYNLDNIYSISIEKFLKKQPLFKFNVITCFEVLEHLSNPKEFIQGIKKFLLPGGYLVITVPNKKRDIRPYFFEKYDIQPNHLTWWDKDTLEFFLNLNGFLIERITDKLDEETLITYLNEKIKLGLIQKKLKILDLPNPQDKEILEELQRLALQKNTILRYVSKVIRPFFKSRGLWIYALARLI